MRVIIVGAGPTGLTAAVELARRGVDLRVVDRRDAASTLSRAVGILPESLELLAPSGATERLLAQGIRYLGAKFFIGGRPVATLPLAGADPTHDFILGLAQDRTEAILAERLQALGGRVDYETELTGLAQTDTAVTATFADGSTDTADYLVGADGVRSTVRDGLGIDFPGIDLPETWSIADVDALGWPHPEHFVICRLKRGRMVVVAPLEPTRYRLVSNTEDAQAALPLAMNVANVRRAATFQISVRQVTDYAKGRVFLAGDAAHCHSPVGGRGMNLGIADAADLAARLAAQANGAAHADPELSLAGYAAARHAAGAATIRGSERARKFVMTSNPLIGALVRPALWLVGTFPPLRRRFARTALGRW